MTTTIKTRVGWWVSVSWQAEVAARAMEDMGEKNTKCKLEDEDVPDTPPELMRLMSAQNYERREAVRRDQKWSQLGKDVEFLEGMVREVNRELHACKKESHTLQRAHMTLREVCISLQELNSEIKNEVLDELDYVKALRAWNSIYKQVKSVQQVYEK